jgi:hypothetical protein
VTQTSGQLCEILLVKHWKNRLTLFLLFLLIKLFFLKEKFGYKIYLETEFFPKARFLILGLVVYFLNSYTSFAVMR